jgi:RND family efflux transporter MFP subunit
VTLKRQEDLRARKVVAQQDYDIALANAKKSQAATESAQGKLDYCFIKSPINGRIGLRNVDVGNLVGPSSSTLVTIQGLDPIYTDFTVAENDLPLVRKYLGGPNVKVETYLADGSITPRVGDLYFMDYAVQPGSGTVKARGVTPNPDRALWPSEFVLVRFILDTLKDATLVPSQAVQISQGGTVRVRGEIGQHCRASFCHAWATPTGRSDCNRERCETRRDGGCHWTACAFAGSENRATTVRASKPPRRLTALPLQKRKVV